MKKWYLCFIVGFITGPAATLPGQQPVEKTNPMRVYMHYQPWFETPATTGGWGWHWTMNTMDPDIIGPDGQRQVASHYYPLIGPYASRDRDVIEYHLLLMKLSGIDGILIDWYGIEGSNGDLPDLLKSSDSIVSYTDDFGMQFGVVLEDRFSRSTNDGKANMAYLRDNYFNRAEYIRYGEDQDPLVCIFGPITFQNQADWDEIMPEAGEEIEFLTLWYESGDAGTNADGEFSWVYQDSQDHLTHLTNFYKNRAPGQKTVMGSAYPGYNDFYEEGGAGSSNFNIPHDEGSTLVETLDRAGLYKDRIDMLQLVTFNDFGEGTMFEPTVENGFDYLERVQEYTGVTYRQKELKLVYRLYTLRKDCAGDTETQQLLDQVSVHLRNLEIEEASQLMESGWPTLISPPGDPGPEQGPGIVLFPNPVLGGKLQLRFKGDPGDSEMTISDFSGKSLFMGHTVAGQEGCCIESLHLDRGIYLFTLQGKFGISTVKFTVLD
jgi:hypothetical protein